MDHIDHAKGNFEDASEEILIEKISKDVKEVLQR